MPKPEGLHSRIFVDGGDQDETRELREKLGFLDGQTTNPSLIAKNPGIAARIAQGEKFSLEELLAEYRQVVTSVSELIPDGSISIEVYADPDTTTSQMIDQARQFNGWIPNAHIKFPTTEAGLAAAEHVVKLGIRVNMTLCFSQAQAAAVYAATKGGESTFVSPFIGRLDDRGENGMQLIEHIQRMYADGDGHVSVLTASVRSRQHLAAALALRSDIITAPAAILREWAADGLPMPGESWQYEPQGLTDIPYQELDLNQDWRSFDLTHPLTESGIERFCADWNALLKEEA